VVGAGTIGQLTARVLVQRGHSVTVFDRMTQRLSLVCEKAATSQELEGLEQFDWIVEATGDQNVLSTLLQRSGTGATLLLMGLPYAHHAFSFESIVSFDRAVIGSVGSCAADFEEALQVLPLIDTRPFLQSAFPLADFEKAWLAVRSRSVLKVMLRPDQSAF
jgi:threonine dehydrogenase-like Zn-dependent dehydrogenase